MTDFIRPLDNQPDVNLTLKKIAWRLTPFLCFCYIASYLDRINIGFAKLQMLEDLHFSDAVFGFGAGLFFLGYIIFEIPSNLILQKVGARIWIARIMISWGVFSALTIFVTNAYEFYIVRFFLGLAEAGFLPGVLFYLSTWFPAHYRGRIMAYFIIGLPLASVIGGPLSGWILSYFSGLLGLKAWQWLFVIEALPAIILGVLALIFLPDNVNRVNWLSAAEKYVVKKALATDQKNRAVKTTIRDSILNVKVWMLGFIDFSILLCTYAIGFWFPSFLKTAGLTDSFEIGLLSSIPGIFGVFTMLVLGASSDYFRERRYHIIIPFLIGAVAIAATTFFTHNPTLTVVFFTIAMGMITGVVPVFFTLPATFLDGRGAAAGFALVISLANIAGVVSNSLIGLLVDFTGSAAGALWLFTAFLILSCVLLLAMPAKVLNR